MIRFTRYRTLPRHEHRIGFLLSVRFGRRQWILERRTSRKTVVPRRILEQFESESARASSS